MFTEILLIDDDFVTLRLHKIAIQKAELTNEPQTFYNGKEAIAHIIKNKNNVDKNYLIFLDINMPIMNGWEFLDYITEHNLTQNITVVMASSSVDMADKIKAESYNCVIGFIEKPLSKNAILNLFDTIGGDGILLPHYLKAS